MKNTRTLLLSYPRSGNTWMRYIIEFLTESKILDSSDRKHFKGPDIKKDNKSFIYKRHNFHLNYKEKFSKMILIVRDFKEAIIRHEKQCAVSVEDWKKQFKDYMICVKYFEIFKGDKNRILINRSEYNKQQPFMDSYHFTDPIMHSLLRRGYRFENIISDLINAGFNKIKG